MERRQFGDAVESLGFDVRTYQGMSAASPVSPRRYRRRILALGGLVFLIVFAVGAAIFVPIVQNDLEDRVEAELIEHDIVGVTASFSGQDGTLVCAEPLDDADRALQLAAGSWGVRTVSLDRTCRADDGGANDSGVPVDSVASTGESTSTIEASADTMPGTDSLADLIAGDALFSQLAGLIDVAGLAGDDALGGSGPLTVLAPTDAAFDAAFDELGADAFGALTSDPEFVRRLLLHHVTEGRIASDDLVSGPLPMLDGTDVDVAVDELTFTSGSSVASMADPATQLDMQASNGVVHAIDRILVPPGLDLSPPPATPASTATLADGVLVLSGAIGSEGQRAQLLAAAGTIDSANVVDELTIDASSAPPAADVDRFAAVVEAMPASLVSGMATLYGGELRLEGTVRSPEDRAALDQLAAGSGVVVDLADRPVADDSTARALEDELNEFVAVMPITFEPGSTELTAEADAVIQQVAARALRLDAIDIVVVGHTDTDGSPENNQLLSEGRATIVRDTLVALGLDDDAVTAEGRGEAEPLLDDNGIEDKVASRRVAFVVTAR
jgi:OOP family OmpA-OmpF porin